MGQSVRCFFGMKLHIVGLEQKTDGVSMRHCRSLLFLEMVIMVRQDVFDGLYAACLPFTALFPL